MITERLTISHHFHCAYHRVMLLAARQEMVNENVSGPEQVTSMLSDSWNASTTYNK